MRDKNKILYHISRDNNWKIGDVIIAGEKENEFWKKCKDFSPVVNVNEESISLFEMFNRCKTFDVTENNVNFLYQHLKGISKEVAFYIREQVFEKVRSEYFSDLPSRQKCLWLTDIKSLDYWKTMSNDRRSLLTLELNGNVFCGDDCWLTANTFSSVEYEKRALHYWNGEHSKMPIMEFLFYGQAIVKNIEII